MAYQTTDTAEADYQKQKGNLAGFMEDAYNKSLGYYKSRGFGGGLEAPGTMESIRQPYVATESKRLSDLWFNTQQNARAWNADTRANIQTGQYYDLTEQQLQAGRAKRQGATVLCTALWRQGLLPVKYLKADLIYLHKHVSPLEHQQYLAWSTPIANAMLQSKLLCYVLYIPLFCWNEFMFQTVKGKKLNLIGLIGKAVNNLGLSYGLKRRMA